jgi:hypothetical protein
MQDVRINKQRLIEILTYNRQVHQKEVDQAMHDFTEAARAALAKAMEEVVDGVWKGVVRIPTPPDHTGDYDRALRMLDLEVQTEVTLTEHEFTQLVMDEWAWKDSFKSITMSYKA